MPTQVNLPNYAKSFEIASLGLYGHNILSGGDTSATGKVYHAVQVLSDCSISYISAFPIASIEANTDSTVTSLSLSQGSTIILGCVKNISVTGGVLIAHLISVTE